MASVSTATAHPAGGLAPKGEGYSVVQVPHSLHPIAKGYKGGIRVIPRPTSPLHCAPAVLSKLLGTLMPRTGRQDWFTFDQKR